MIRLLVVAATVAALAGATSIEAKAPPFVGAWKGSVQAETGSTVVVVLKLGPKIKSASSGTISYPGSKCAGKLEYLKLSGRVLTLRERITKGRCAKGGSVVLSQIDFRTLYLEWYGTAATAPALKGYLALGV